MALSKVKAGGIDNIAAALEAASDSNKFTDADHSKLNAIEASATADQTATQIKAAVEAASDSNTFTDADHSKLNAIEASATADQTAAQIKTALENGIDSVHYVNGSIDTEHLGDDQVTAAKLANSINTDIATGPAALPKAGGIMTGDLILNDDVRLEVGSASGGDLQIFHDTSNSYIQNSGVGNLVIKDSDGDIIIQAKSGENSIVANNDGSVQLYNDNNLKLETTSYGAYVAGELRTGSKLQAGAIGDAATNTITVQSSDKSYFQAKTQNDNENSALMFGNASNAYDGRVEYVERNMKFYTATVERMQIKSDGKVGIGTAAPQGTTHIETASAGSISPNTAADDLVIENSSHGGLTVFTPDANNSRVSFGSPSDSIGADLIWNYNSGIFKMGADKSGGQLVLTANNGNEALRIKANLNVGIGTTTADSKLHIASSHTSTSDPTNCVVQILQNTSDTDNAYGVLCFKDAQGSDATLIATKYTDHSANRADLSFWTRDGGSCTQRMGILANGNVGIGTASPSAKLDVRGIIRVDDANPRIRLIESDTTNLNTQIQNQGGDLLISTLNNAEDGATTRITLDHATGNVGIGKTPIRALDIKATGDPGIRLESASHSMDVLTLRNGNGRLDVGGTGTITILANGNTGVGTTSPAAKLHVKDVSSTTNVMINAMNVEAATTGTAANGVGVRMTFWGSMTNQNNVELGQIGFVNESVNGAHGAFVVKTRPNATSAERFRISNGGNVTPGADGTQDFGSSTKRWANIFTGDLHLSNENSKPNEVDGTNGNWTIQEGDENLYIKNNKTGKKYKFNLEEIT